MNKADFVRGDETLEELGVGNLLLIQKKNGFRFGTDAVLLAHFAKDTVSDRTLDLCTGSGIVPILLSHKSKAKKICGIEIQEEVFETAVRSVELNGLTDKVTLYQGDLKNCTDIFPKRSFSLVTCNPPYIAGGSGIKCPDNSKFIARHEVMCTLDDVVRVAEAMLKDGGHFCMVHRPSRLSDVIETMRKYKIEPKRLRLVHPHINSEPALFLIDGLRRGGNELRVMPPLILYDDNMNETEELKRIYERI